MVATAENPQTVGTLEAVTFNTYRDIHKGIRAELFSVVTEAGRVDPGDRTVRTEFAGHVGRVVELLVAHAEHEDAHVQPVLEAELPHLAERVPAEHAALDARLLDLRAIADEAVNAPATEQREQLYRIYIELASFASAYLAHQDYEERVIMPALERAVGVDAVIGLHQTVLANIPPDEMAHTLAVMLPAMNVDDRTDMLGAMRATAPEPVFTGVWGLAASVLTPADHAQLGARLGIS